MKAQSLDIPFGNAICYSGYRDNQSPVDGTYPSYDQVCEDLAILASHWDYLRLYDCSQHADLVLEAIHKEGLDFKVMLGVDMRAEISNPNCPWDANYSDAVLAANRRANSEEVDRMIELSTIYPESVFAVSVGNEATVDWSDHLVPVEQLIDYVRRIKKHINQPVTFCENYVPWTQVLEPLAAELDFISVHTYPVWEYKNIEEAMQYTQENYLSVASHYPDKPVIITEAGWTTRSNGRGIEPWNANEQLQAHYYSELVEWSRKHQILTFVFEAFDEPWKGSPDPMEPEKHWGIFTVDRKPKPVMQDLYAHLHMDESEVDVAQAVES